MQGQVKIVNFPASSVAMLTHYGQPELINETAARFIEWRKTTGYSPVASSQTYGLAPDDPATTPSDEFAFHICGTVTSPIAEDNR